MLIAFITLITHWLALSDGVVLDDHWHQKGLREHGWGFSELLRTLDITPSEFTNLWWQTREVKWHYLRPFFIVCMKFMYTVVGGNSPVALHAFSLALHLISALLVWRLCWLLTRHEAASIFGGIVFAIYPHSVITVAWPSSQNVVLQTALLLGVILAYVRASGLRLGPETWTCPPPATVPLLARRWLAPVFALWILALLTRENAVLLPAILGSLDLAFGGRRHVWQRRGVYLAFFVLGCAFVAWREWMGIHPLPDVYCRRPAGDWAEYLPWLAAKILHYLCVSIWVAPMSSGPTGRYTPWQTVPGDCLLMLGFVVVIGGVYWLSTRRARGAWIWPLWIFLSILPVAAVVEKPHSGYMCAVGFAVAMALAPVAVRFTRSKWLTAATLSLVSILFLGVAFMTPVNRLQWLGIAAAERYTPSWVEVSPPPAGTRDIFFINLPFVDVYTRPNLVARLGPELEKINVHVLTYAPHILEMNQRTVLEQIDEHSFTVTIEGQAYFSRLLGRFLLEAFRGRDLFKPGDVIEADACRVTIVDADAQGVWKLQFTFPRPLQDPGYCFYLTTKVCGAARLRFGPARDGGVTARHDPARIESLEDLDRHAGRLSGGRAAAADPLFDAASSSNAELADRAASALQPVVRHMAGVLGAPVQALLDKDELSRSEWQHVRAWWSRHVDDQYLRELWLLRNTFDDLIWLRYEIEFDRYIASFVFKSDLYLTGPPFDNPRGY
ncbi:MAG: hypothetical protein DCC65_16645 [Planctomycetota bacterium]|nr:MAG: hypothetical protein DCC65_16645 [Planctomycetota bacterium]